VACIFVVINKRRRVDEVAGHTFYGRDLLFPAGIFRKQDVECTPAVRHGNKLGTLSRA